jgi:hypothetical protein
LGRSPLQNPLLLLALATSSLLVGAAFIYISIKAPFYWGGAYLPGLALLLVFVVISILGVASILRKPVRANTPDGSRMGEHGPYLRMILYRFPG